MQFSRRWSTHDCLDEAYVSFFGAVPAAWDDAMVARWSANSLGMLWPERMRHSRRRMAAARPRRADRWSSSLKVVQSTPLDDGGHRLPDPGTGAGDSLHPAHRPPADLLEQILGGGRQGTRG